MIRLPPIPNPLDCVLFDAGGDQPAMDVAGARKVGITPVLIDRFARHPDPDGAHRVTSLTELVELRGVPAGGDVRGPVSGSRAG
jgi:hypothetical protein